MADNISIELTQDQLDNLNAILIIGLREMRDAKILTDSFPKEISLKKSFLRTLCHLRPKRENEGVDGKTQTRGYYSR